MRRGQYIQILEFCCSFDSNIFLQSLREELERVYKEEQFPSWHFQSFSRCSSYLLSELHKMGSEPDKQTGMLVKLRNVSKEKIQSCLSELSFQLNRTRYTFPWNTLDVTQDDLSFHNFRTEERFAAFSTLMRDR